MRQPIADVERFYESAQGRCAARILGERVAGLWGACEGMRVLGLGAAVPLIAPFAAHAASAVNVLPRETGPVRWDGSGRGNATLRAELERLPFKASTFDRALLLHGLEETYSPRATLRELWRVMAPEGRIIIAAANRAGLWARAEGTPFGHGRPWTRAQLDTLLSDGLFEVTASSHALYMPPVDWALIRAGAEGWERAGPWVAPGLGGVVMVEAVKRVHIDPRGSAAAPVLGRRLAAPGGARPAPAGREPANEPAPCPAATARPLAASGAARHLRRCSKRTAP